MEDLIFSHDIESQEFEASKGGLRAFITYRSNREGKIFLVHTEVPEVWRSQGVAEKLAEYAFAYIRKNRMRIIPMCSFIKAYIKRHSEHQDLLSPGIELR